ncbi:Peptidyl-prolyl cis-trans isomerase FKBP15-1 [Ananas comosus]|uniref:peptidylprolyl isomerase n=1 Tax=Ananas comosus TaxID=4615 RepID=A0A199W0N5_ANACO|nr:Peptidyl-prolyl cis-trans isomerase FKBP15-1 [Ananas comosus]
MDGDDQSPTQIESGRVRFSGRVRTRHLYPLSSSPSLQQTLRWLSTALSFSSQREATRRKRRRRKSMAKLLLSIVLIAAIALFVSAKKSGDVTELQIGVKYKPETCSIQAHKGDRIKVHYRGTLTDGKVFDSSFERGDPIEFELGSGQVIKGWDQGLLGMCIGEKRKLKIPAKLGYGTQGSPPTIPGGATLIFDTELVAINGKTSEDGKSAEANSEL